jgi:hypothetical protein
VALEVLQRKHVESDGPASLLALRLRELKARLVEV